jgi:hypothetical protein
MTNFKGMVDIVLQVSEYSPTSGCGPISDIFGDEHQIFKDAYVFPPHDGLPHGDPCFVAGKLHINAGIIIDSIPRAQNITYYPSANSPLAYYFDIERTGGIRPDRLVIPTLTILPKVLTTIGLKNTTQIPLWNNLDKYIKSIINIAYCATWDSWSWMIYSRSDKQRPIIEIPFLEGTVNKTRVFSWLVFNLLFTASGILDIILQSTSSRPVIIDTAAVALTTAMSALRQDEDVAQLNWRNMSSVSRKDAFTFDEKKKPVERILLKLEKGEEGFVLARKRD